MCVCECAVILSLSFPLMLCFPYRLLPLTFQLSLNPPLFLPLCLPWKLSEGTKCPSVSAGTLHAVWHFGHASACINPPNHLITCKDFGNVGSKNSTINVSVTGEEGPSLMALEDMAMIRALPTATIFYPSDGVSTEKAVELATTTKVSKMQLQRLAFFAGLVAIFKKSLAVMLLSLSS